ncbi:TRAP transporter large permease [Aeribacillus pallidus]|jgi:TRAP transporter, DctM subunit|uniref:TRAP transporter large permease n=1 Tax=Aeribacillus TaxID=1055323 RepID=UPI0007B4EF72|nr:MULTISPECIES: TRAP transporter large permease [Aeribacillus]KZM53008.1 C4-dicarboxylate ABC transporter permease [Aeribacillus pallidus]MDR9792093.1 TRAP transporter large permease [Aeribacillus pallidus]MED0652340.1 TRAP transporter large permease [Aeribacillus composti]MED4488206.1 TRAP transporter large permease [Aeribacillus pallidus]RZI52374.1 TRAP transporter large permease [Aeribacillus pallidus]
MAIALLIFIILLLLQVPIAFVLGITTILYILLTGNTGLLSTAPQRLYSGLESYGLLAIPLFMMAGELMNSGGITKRLIRFATTLVGHFKGGLAYVNVVSNMLLASIIGSATAQIAMMSKIMVPSMEKEGYSREFSASTTAAAGLLGPIIPPSMLFIIYGVSSGASIGSMFLAGIMPGVLLGIAFILLIAYTGYKQKWQTHERAKISVMFKSFLNVIPALLVPFIIIVGILSGVFTPTESAAFACVVALVIGFFIYKELKIKDLPTIMINTAISSAIITMLIAMANLFGWMLSFERIPQTIASWMTSLTENPFLFLLLVNIFLLIVGMFMDGIAALIILVPIFTPIIANYGIDPIHFGVIICINLTIGLLTPPVGAGLYLASSLGNVKLEALTKAILPFLVVSIIALFIITYWPQMVLWLPNIIK